MGSNIYPTAGGRVMKSKNANCEGGLNRIIYASYTHIIDPHGTY